MIQNYTELVVNDLLSPVLEEYARRNPEVCTCPRCREDVAALALNQLPPCYVTSEKGVVLTRTALDRAPLKGQVVAAIVNAVRQVAASPRHGKGDHRL
ncbi:late competence development ComFB family protein [Desulfofundulus sp. TPOSR]|uniref:late competence development ComFB family protein n=1 Tax=Desulfofundulus sp. TPOSR TaxID=2714340 RepID=UPI00140B704A|nr:late competence development ComFB family protein [Desulfofundulus sp. TPOSR]NHM28144.1 late competence development ComFB family protein [Desulfofundulus sp. TPOSR]